MAIKPRTTLLSMLAFAALIGSVRGDAAYNNNIVGVVDHVLTYDSPTILFRLRAMPTGPCSDYFIIPAEVSTEARQQLLARLLLAHSSREPVNIGYDNVTCIGGYFRVHRVG